MGSLWETSVTGEGCRTGQREELKGDAGTIRASATPIGSSRAGAALSVVLNWPRQPGLGAHTSTRDWTRSAPGEGAEPW